ncbi:hypothetical protein [Alicyclobacillus fastidiosus]|uniref:Ribbon-helix-helix protein CopG domain-containing protein n=1 Tax=Alicyclobacillus fastidiosus TaxID=392011 RepID=A0ABV5AHF2_9BACL|nr:hypothetical protein [Alicyclobacillus fastidiosus]WEH09198.1 hypothetical protein PYS47_21405 [Alicyclobacillus fastidiosus]
MDEEKRKRGRPPKKPSESRSKKISTYVSEEVSHALHKEAEARGMTISELVATLLETHVYGDKKDVQLAPVPRDAIYSVMRALADEGLILGANVSPKTESSAEFAPKTSRPTSMGTKAEEQRGDDSRLNVAPKR